MRMVLCLLRASYNVTIADTDAVFLSDASPWLSGYDLVASRGNFPEWSAERWGASLCLGLARFNTGAHVASLTKHLVERTQSLRDDQRAVNHVLHEADASLAPETADGKLLFATSTTTAAGATRLVKVGLIAPRSLLETARTGRAARSSCTAFRVLWTPSAKRSKGGRVGSARRLARRRRFEA